MNKQVIRIALFAVITLFVAACGGLEKRIDSEIETVGSELTGVPVQVERVKLTLLQGSGEITHTTVANPERYAAEYALNMGLARLNLGIIATLTREPLVLDELIIDSPVLNFERSATNGSNVKVIADHVRARQEPAEDKSAEEHRKADKPSDKPLRIVVRKLVIKGVTFNIQRGDGTTESGTLPAVELTDVGGSEGKSAAGLAMVVFLAIAREMFKEVVAPRLRERLNNVHLDLERLDARQVMTSLEKKLALSGEQVDQMRPIIEQKSRDIKNAIEEAHSQGFLDIQHLGERFSAATAQIEEQFKEVLTYEQMDQLNAAFADLHHFTTEEIQNALAEEVTAFLNLGHDKSNELRPILIAEIQKRSELLHKLAKDPEFPFTEFQAKFAALQDEARQKLSAKLDPDQILALERRQAQLRDLVQQAYFGTVAPRNL